MELKETVSLDQYQNVVVLYRDENGALFIGNTYDYHGRTPDSRYLSIMYHESLDETLGIMGGWNYLDDNSPTITLVPVPEIEYHEVSSYPKIETYVRLSPVRRGTAVGFVMK